MGKPCRALDPVGQRDGAARLDQPRGLGHQPRLIDHVAPGVFAPDEVGRGGREAGGAGVGQHEADSLGQSFGFIAAAAHGEDRFRGVDPDHSLDIAEPHQEPHPGPGAAAKVHAGHTGADFARAARSSDERSPPMWICCPMISSHNCPSAPL